MADTRQTVGPVGKAVFGVPERCPECGGQLAPAFGLIVDDAGLCGQRPYLDPTSAWCRDCGTSFRVEKGDG